MELCVRLPLFIVFEGIDGSGKTTLRNYIYEKLKDEGFPVLSMREPTDGVYGQRLRELLKGPLAPDIEDQLDLFMKDRADDMEKNIKPALEQKMIILMDRYYFSNAAYQGAFGVSPKRILKLNTERGFARPDRVYFVDIEPEEAMRRVTSRNIAEGSEKECFERKGFLSDVRAIFKDIADETFVTIDGTLPTEEQAILIINDLNESFGE